MLEIGVQTQKSVRMWEEFFPNAVVHGLDIDPKCKQFESGRVKIHIGDQSDKNFLQSVTNIAGGFDLIIDDGSHIPQHQIASFEHLFPTLSQHGIYVVEDTGGCVGDFSNSVINILRSLTDYVNFWPQGFRTQDWPYLSRFPDNAPWLAKNISGLAFYRWMVFVFRGDNPRENPYLKELSTLKPTL